MAAVNASPQPQGPMAPDTGPLLDTVVAALTEQPIVLEKYKSKQKWLSKQQIKLTMEIACGDEF